MLFDGRIMSWIMSRPKLIDSLEYDRSIAYGLCHGIKWINGIKRGLKYGKKER